MTILRSRVRFPVIVVIFLFLRLVYQIDQNFALIKDLRSKIPTNTYFGHQRAVKLGNRGLKTFKRPSLSCFRLDHVVLSLCGVCVCCWAMTITLTQMSCCVHRIILLTVLIAQSLARSPWEYKFMSSNPAMSYCINRYKWNNYHIESINMPKNNWIELYKSNSSKSLKLT